MFAATFPAYLILLDLIDWIIFVDMRYLCGLWMKWMRNRQVVFIVGFRFRKYWVVIWCILACSLNLSRWKLLITWFPCNSCVILCVFKEIFIWALLRRNWFCVRQEPFLITPWVPGWNCGRRLTLDLCWGEGRKLHSFPSSTSHSNF